MNGLQWFQVLVSLIGQTSVITGLAWYIEKRTPSAMAKARVWNACFISLLWLLCAAILLPRLEWLYPWSGMGPQALLAVATTEQTLGICLLAIWGCGCGFMALRSAMQFVQVRMFIAKCPPYPVEVQRRLRAQIPVEISGPCQERILFRQSPCEFGPFCYQFHQPLIFLPASLLDGDSIVLEHVLRHEITHLQTQHPMYLFLEKLTQVVLWCQPLVWIGGRRSSLVREFVCDDAACGAGARTASYLRTVLRLVESRTRSPVPSLMFGRSQSELALRARRLASGENRSTNTRASGPGIVLGVAIILSQIWLPTNPLASRYAMYSPWPHWSATVAHAFGFRLRDFEAFDADLQVDELRDAK